MNCPLNSDPKSTGIIPNNEEINHILEKAAPNDNLKKLFVRYSDYGPALLEHLLLSNHNVPINTKKKDFDEKNIDAAIISAVLQETRDFLVNNQAKGFILQKVRTTYLSRLFSYFLSLSYKEFIEKSKYL